MVDSVAEFEENTQQSDELITPINGLSGFERFILKAFPSFLLILLLGSIILPSLFWDDFLKPLVWDPIKEDAVRGDSGYTIMNTALFALILFGAVFTLSILFRIGNLPSEERTLISLIPWVVLAAVVRVLEDAHFFDEKYDIIFISPLIHFHLTFWVVLAGFVGWISAKIPKRVPAYWIPTLLQRRSKWYSLIFLLAMWLLLFVPSHASHSEMGMLWIWIGLFSGLISSNYLLGILRFEWHPIERTLFSIGIGAVLIGLGYWFQFHNTPWETTDGGSWWPAFVILGVPSMVCFQLWRMGYNSAVKLRDAGMEPGIIPDGSTVYEWEDGEHEDKEFFETETPRALLASPLVLAFTFGQLTDGLATWIGIDVFGYGEKHPVSDTIISIGANLTGSGGAWLFFAVKALLVALLIWVFSMIRVEQRHRHLRILIVLALLVVGLAPGLRDLGRLLLGV